MEWILGKILLLFGYWTNHGRSRPLNSKSNWFRLNVILLFYRWETSCYVTSGRGDIDIRLVRLLNCHVHRNRAWYSRFFHSGTIWCPGETCCAIALCRDVGLFLYGLYGWSSVCWRMMKLLEYSLGEISQSSVVTLIKIVLKLYFYLLRLEHTKYNSTSIVILIKLKALGISDLSRLMN